MEYRKILLWGIFSFIILFLFSCTNKNTKIQGEWTLTECSDGPINTQFYDFRIKFIGDSLEIINFRYGYDEYKSDTLHITIEGNTIHYKNDSIFSIIQKLTDDILIIEYPSNNGEKEINKFKRVKSIEYYASENTIASQKHYNNIGGEWIIMQWTEHSFYDEIEWEDYGKPVGWRISFSKDGTGYQIKDDNSVISFNWQLTNDGETLIITNTEYEDTAIKIISMTKHTMHLKLEDEEIKLVRVD